MGEELVENSPTMTREEAERAEKLLLEKAKESAPQPEQIPMRRLIEKWYPTLREMRTKGYTPDMLITVLNEIGVKITKKRLSTYMTLASKSAKEKGANGLRSDRESASGAGARRTGSFEMRPDRKL
jgi:hypothetical protein